MILKTMRKLNNGKECWSWVDNICAASFFYDENSKQTVVSITLKDVEGQGSVVITDIGYLCNDKGEVIDCLKSFIEENSEKVEKKLDKDDKE